MEVERVEYQVDQTLLDELRKQNEWMLDLNPSLKRIKEERQKGLKRERMSPKFWRTGDDYHVFF